MSTGASSLIPSAVAQMRAIAEEDLYALGATDRAELLMQLGELSQAVEALQLRLVRLAETCGDAQVLGHGTTKSFLTAQCGLAPVEAGAAVRTATMLRDLPATEQALADGTLTVGRARVITKAVADLPDHRPESVESTLLPQALDQAISHRKLAELATDMRVMLDPDGVLGDEQARYRRRSASIRPTPDGMVEFRALLTAEVGEKARTALDALTPLPVGGAYLPARMRRADGFERLIDIALNTGQLPTTGGLRPHLTVTVGLDALRDAASRHPAVATATRSSGAGHDCFAIAGAEPLPFAELSEWDALGPIPAAPRTEYGVALTAVAALRIGCDAALTRMVMGPDSQPLDVGRETYAVPTAMRRAVIARDRYCRFPGCDRKPAWCDAHHVQHWAHGGETKLDNLILLCARHHHSVHEGRWGITRNAKAQWIFQSPTAVPASAISEVLPGPPPEDVGGIAA